MNNFDREARPWAYRTTTPQAVKDLPKPEPEEIVINDENTYAFNREALQQEEERIQREVAEQIDPTLAPEEIRVIYAHEMAKQAEVDVQQQAYRAATVFVAEQPAYIANQRNAKRIASWLEARGYDGCDSNQFHEAFEALSAQNLLQVNVEPAAPRRELTTKDLYSMPLEDLARLADEETRNRNSGTRLVRVPKRPR
jgi:hypothetical protein